MNLQTRTTPIPFKLRGSKRISTTVPAHVHDALERLSAEQGRSLSNLAAFALELYVEQHLCSTSAVPMQQPSTSNGQGH